MDTKLVIRDVAGAVINIGPWDFQTEPVMASDLDKPIHNQQGELVGHEQKQIGERPRNPLPAGAYESTADIATSDDGGLYATENHRGLRAGEYPPIGDQLDSLFKAGLFPPDMAAQLQAVKNKFPKIV